MLGSYVACLLLFGAASVDAQWSFVSEPGVLVKVSFQGQIATLIPHSTLRYPVPAATLQSIAKGLLEAPDQYWLSKIQAQIGFVLHRQVYRRQYALEDGVTGKGQLVLPPPDVWNITLDRGAGNTRIEVRNGNRFVVLDYTFESVLIARRGSVKRAEPRLANIGDQYLDRFLVPLDPDFFFQRTGYACIDESKTPVFEVTSINAWRYFDWECVPNGLKNRRGRPCRCHHKFRARSSCLRSMHHQTGIAELKMHWTRMAYDETIAAQFRVGGPRGDVSRDLENKAPRDFNIVYKYIPADSCLLKRDRCLTGAGWRRLLQFTTTAEHVGRFRFLNIARVGFNPNDTMFGQMGMYQEDTCLNEYEHASFANYRVDGIDGEPFAICLHDTIRTANHEYSPVATQYDRCDWQGISAGWSYQIPKGSPCNWVDITTVSTSGTHNFGSVINPNELICEGIPELTTRPRKQIFGDSFIDTNGRLVRKPNCTLISEFAANNAISRRIKPRARQSAVTSKCAKGFARPLSFLRDCGWRVMKEALTCQPGKNTLIMVQVDKLGMNPTQISALPTVAVRVCESSRALGNISTRCEYVDALAHGVVPAKGIVPVYFRCPAARDAIETGGLFSVLAAKYAAFEVLDLIVPNITVTTF